MGWSKATEGCGAVCLGPRAVGGVWNEHQLEGGPCTKVESAEVEARHAEWGGGEDEEENSLENGGFQSPCLITKSCLTLCHPIHYSTPGFPVLHHLPKFAQTHVHWVGDTSNHLILCCPFSSCLQSFPASGSFSSESAFLIRWPKYLSFNFSISPSNEYSGLISFKTDWFDLLAVQGTLRSLLGATVPRHQFFGALPSLQSSCHKLLQSL